MLNAVEVLFDRVWKAWESPVSRRIQGALLLLVFFVALVLIESCRRKWLPVPLLLRISTNHLVAIETAFTVLLVLESVELVFSFVQSVTISVGKQFEILSLILLRGTFKKIADVGEPLTWDRAVGILPDVAATTVGALGIFALLCMYHRLTRKKPAGIPDGEAAGFVRVKKGIALILLAAFAWICVHDLWSIIIYKHPERVFEHLFTLLIFSDVLMVLVALIYTQNYRIAFRNSAFAVAAVVIRLALVAPMMMGAALGMASAAYVLVVVVVFQRFQTANEED